jgi:hypothetical protein
MTFWTCCIKKIMKACGCEKSLVTSFLDSLYANRPNSKFESQRKV